MSGGKTEIILRVLGDVHRFERASVVVGRGAESDVRAEDKAVSRRHVEIVARPDGVTVRDLGSTHGTWLDGRRVEGETRLVGRAVVTLGRGGIPVEILRAERDGHVLVSEGSSSSALRSSHTVAMSESQIEATRQASRDAASADGGPGGTGRRGPGFGSGMLLGVLLGAAAGAAVLWLVDLGSL